MFWLQLSTLLFGLGIATADCNSPPAIANTTNNLTGTPPYADGTLVEYRCNNGYRDAGTSRIYSCSGTEWIGDYSCNQISCGYIETPDNGRVTNTPTYTFGSLIIFACNEGHIKSGDSSLLCRSDGAWYPNTAPTCTAVDCGDFGFVANGYVFQEANDDVLNNYASVVRVECEEEFIINGSPEVTCNANGHWGTKPTCVPSTCPWYPGLNSSCIYDVEMSSSGGLLYLYCKEGDDISVTNPGRESAVCLDNEWDDTEMACFCDCKINADLSVVTLLNLNAKGFLPHDEELIWSCKNGATKNTNKALVCNDGNIETPLCTPIPDDSVHNSATTTDDTIHSSVEITDTTIQNSVVKTTGNTIQTSVITSKNKVMFKSAGVCNAGNVLGIRIAVPHVVCLFLLVLILQT